MRIKELLIDFYQELKDDNNQIYDINGTRSKISSKAEKLLNISEEIIKIAHKTNKSEVVNIEVDLLLSYEANLIGEYKYIEDNLGNILDEFLIFY